MFGWRKRSEGFEWNEYIRTTVLVRRADRQRRLDDVRLAALAQVKDVRDRGVEASKKYLLPSLLQRMPRPMLAA